MSQGWDNYEAAPLEYLHGRAHQLFIEYLKSKAGDGKYSVEIDGSVFMTIVGQAKVDTYKKYPKQVNSNAILKTDI
jgi:hypothetical protein